MSTKKKKEAKHAFTLSEVIITLVVIGIVAAITVPMMSNSAHDKKWNVARQKAQATIGEAFRLMTVNGEITTKNADGTDRTTEYMVTKVLPKYLKLEKTCAPAKYSQCGFPSTVKTPSGGSIGVTPNNYKWSELSQAMVWNSNPANGYDSNSVIAFTQKYGTTYNTNYYFRTLDGFSVAFLYNPYCAGNHNDHYVFTAASNGKNIYGQAALDMVCLMGIYDMNGKAGPNRIGYDIGFVGSFYNGFETKTAAVLPHETLKKYSQSMAGSNTWQKLYNYCDSLGNDKEWIMPDIFESTLLYLNNMLINKEKSSDATFLTRTPLWVENAIDWMLYQTYGGAGGYFRWEKKTTTTTTYLHIRCVRRTQLK